MFGGQSWGNIMCVWVSFWLKCELPGKTEKTRLECLVQVLAQRVGLGLSAWVPAYASCFNIGTCQTMQSSLHPGSSSPKVKGTCFAHVVMRTTARSRTEVATSNFCRTYAWQKRSESRVRVWHVLHAEIGCSIQWITCCAYLCFNMRRMRLVKRLFNYDRFVNLVHGAFFCKGDR